MFHIDRKNRLQLSIGTTISFSKGSPNYSLHGFTDLYSRMPGSGRLVAILNTFAIEDKFPIEDLYNLWSEEKLSKRTKYEAAILRKHRVEIVYEFVRKNYYADLISRYEGFFLTTLPDEWIQVLAAGEEAVVYEFELLETKVEKYDARWTELSMISETFTEVFEHAHNYWKGISTEQYRAEILCLGTLRVKNKFSISENKVVTEQ